MCLGLRLVHVSVSEMQAFVIIDSGGIIISAGVNVKNCLIKVGVMMGLFGILARVNLNMASRVMLVNT